jgi:predicted SAM-dependent methyltransferase
MSETSKARNLLLKYCRGNGIDIGHGGDKISPFAISIDLPTPYTCVGMDVTQLKGDGRDLYWFTNESLDFVYSSHLLEDFEDTKKVLQEWCRVLKQGGHLVLLLPDQKIYSKFSWNEHHHHMDFSSEFVKQRIPNNMKLIYESGIIYDYNFALVYKKDIL